MIVYMSIPVIPKVTPAEHQDFFVRFYAGEFPSQRFGQAFVWIVSYCIWPYTLAEFLFNR